MFALGLGEDARRRDDEELRARLAEPARRSLTQDAMLTDGLLSVVLLAIVAEGSEHGHAATKRLNRLGFTLASERVVYPALGRMEVAGWIEGYLASTPDGAPRKCYRMLPEGERALDLARRNWREFSAAVAPLLEGL